MREKSQGSPRAHKTPASTKFTQHNDHHDYDDDHDYSHDDDDDDDNDNDVGAP